MHIVFTFESAEKEGLFVGHHCEHEHIPILVDKLLRCIG
jgi:hypothetical protein